MSTNEVVIQPHRRTLTGSRLDELARTARQQGMAGDSFGAAVAYRPSVGWVLIGGEHRWKALSAPGSKTRVLVLTCWADLVAWMAVDVTDPRRLGWDPVAAVYFYEKAVATLKPTRSDRALDDVSEFTGVHRGVLEGVRLGRSIIQDPDEDQDVQLYVQELLDQLEAGGLGGHSVRDQVAKYKAKKAAAGRQPTSVAAQRKALESVGQLVGIVGALADLGPINPELPMAEREAHARLLGSLGAQIARIKRNLRGEQS
jgi:hypothetical protein